MVSLPPAPPRSYAGTFLLSWHSLSVSHKTPEVPASGGPWSSLSELADTQAAMTQHQACHLPCRLLTRPQPEEQPQLRGPIRDKASLPWSTCRIPAQGSSAQRMFTLRMAPSLWKEQTELRAGSLVSLGSARMRCILNHLGSESKL